MARVTCKECDCEMIYKKGIKKETGKPWQGWFCTNKECKAVEWVKSDPIPQPTAVFTGSTPIAHTTTPPAKIEPKKEHDRDWIQNKRALTMQAFSLFPPRTNEDGTTPSDRWNKVREMRDIMLGDLYSDNEVPF